MNRYNWWQVYSSLAHMMVYHISKVCLALMYMQQGNMLCVKLIIDHFLILDLTENDNAYSTPLRHKVWNVDHKMVILGIHFCYNTYSHLGMQYQHYTEHDTVCLSIFLSWIFVCIFHDQWHHFCGIILSDSVEIS